MLNLNTSLLYEIRYSLDFCANELPKLLRTIFTKLIPNSFKIGFYWLSKYGGKRMFVERLNRVRRGARRCAKPSPTQKNAISQPDFYGTWHCGK